MFSRYNTTTRTHARTHRVNAAVEHDGLAHVFEDDAAATNLVASTYWHDPHRLMIFIHHCTRNKTQRISSFIDDTIATSDSYIHAIEMKRT